MTKIFIPYGVGEISAELPPGISTEVILSADTPGAEDQETVVRAALEKPLGQVDLKAFCGAGTVAIAINDKTRPVPHHYLLPPLLSKLEQEGFLPENIKLIVATGTHTPMPPTEFHKILPGEIISKYHVISHDCDDNANLDFFGSTSRGTPILINRHFSSAELRIVIGNIEPHHFMGFSGGVKSAAIGLAGRETINKNHAMLVLPDARIAEYDHNPTRQDAEEIGRVIGVHFSLNAILNQQREIVYALAGGPLEVMHQGIPLARSVCQTPVKSKYDIIISSPGGYPKDINLYQSQKAISHASMITRDGGTVILVAQCSEGSGSYGFEQFMTGVNSPDQVFEKIKREGFSVGPHKAIQFARELKRIHIVLISNLPPDLVRKFLLTPAACIEEAVQMAWKFSGSRIKKIALMPKAINTIPMIK